MNMFFWGASAMASVVVALFFWKFYRDTSDRLFAWFSLAFGSLSAHWLGLGIVNPEQDVRHYFYVLRLAAFLMLLAGIIDKNGRSRRSGGSDSD